MSSGEVINRILTDSGRGLLHSVLEGQTDILQWVQSDEGRSKIAFSFLSFYSSLYNIFYLDIRISTSVFHKSK